MTKQEQNCIKRLQAEQLDVEAAQGFLSRASWHGWCRVAEAAIALGANVNRLDKQGFSPLQRYITRRPRHDPEFVQLLIDAGADLNRPGIVSLASIPILPLLVRGGASLDEAPDGSVPLVEAIMCHAKADYPIALIEAGADVNRMDRAHLTPLLAACIKGREKLVQRLLEAGASSSVIDIGGRSPMRIACEAVTRIPHAQGWCGRQHAGAKKIVKLLKNRLPAQPEDSLLAALALDDVAELQALLDGGISPDEEVLGPYGDRRDIARLETFLRETSIAVNLDKLPVAKIPIISFAAAAGSDRCVRLLLDRGADARRRDTFGHLPETYAEGSLHRDLAMVLRDAASQ